MFEVLLLPEAEKFYKKAQRPLAKKLARCFARLEADPRKHANIKPLTGPLAGSYRYRTGEFRVLYKIDDAAHAVYVYKIVHRREAYS